VAGPCPDTSDLLDKIVVQLAPSALHATAETLTGQLGTDGWQVNELIIDGIISLDGPHDRQIGMRLLGDGTRIQLWATGGSEPANPEPTKGTFPLPTGHRWHTPVHIGHLEADKDPAAVLYDAIADHLLPVFDTKPLYVGHRPWDAPAEPEPEPLAKPQAPAEQPEVKRTAVPKPVVKRTRSPKRTPAAEGDAKSSTTGKRTAAKPAIETTDSEPKPGPTHKRTSAKPVTS
jgi:hypothetical protein